MSDRITVNEVRLWPKEKPLLALTAYDYPMGRTLDEAGVDILHVGDSIGMVVLGFEDTLSVTVDDIVRAVGAVNRGRKRALLTADLPAGSYETPTLALENARRIVEAGADAVKLEGGADMVEQISALCDAGIEVMGHIGMLPQRIKEEGGYKRKGKTEEEIQRLRNDAQAVVDAGVFAMVLEVVVHEVAKEISDLVPVPTLGIASGAGTDGQIRVIHDVLGMFPWFQPAHAKPEENLHYRIQEAVSNLRKHLFP
jgi:3-methyl-2-oxobutanoate hydroxymethyltransferase